MKTVIRNAMVLACMGLLLWGGVAVPAEPPPAPESCEYLMDAIECYPLPQHGRSPVAGIVASDQMEAATARSYGNVEPLHAWQLYYLGVPNAPEPVPAWGTVEYLAAMDEGTLPSQPFEPNPPDGGGSRGGHVGVQPRDGDGESAVDVRRRALRRGRVHHPRGRRNAVPARGGLRRELIVARARRWSTDGTDEPPRLPTRTP